MLNRTKVAEVFNQSHLSVFMGQSGQNDRGPLESLACGTPIMLAATARHCPSIWKDNLFCRVSSDPNDITSIAYELKDAILSFRKKGIKKRCYDRFQELNGLYDVVLPEMKRLFDIIRKHPKPDIQPLIKEYIKK
jgi:hypothetical protein